MTVGLRLVEGLDDGQRVAVTAMLTAPRPVITVVGPAGAGKTRMLACSVHVWQHRFDHGWNADGSHRLRDQDPTATDTY